MFSVGLCKKKEPHHDSNVQPGSGGLFGTVISDVGCVRENNEDNFVFGRNINRDSVDRCRIDVSYSEFPNEWLAACVFDGMGDGAMGEVASHNTAEIFLDVLNGLTGFQAKAEVDLILRKAFLEANNHIISLRRESSILGTTAAVFCSNGSEFKVYYLGDSRVYLVRNEEMVQLTKDQTLAQMKIDAGIYFRDDPMVRVDKHKLTDYIGRDQTRENMKPEESPWFSFQKGDRILLCSDGLTNMCTDDEISGILAQTASASNAAGRLIDAAKANGGADNITCIVIFCS